MDLETGCATSQGLLTAALAGRLHFGDNWHHVIRVEKIDDALLGPCHRRLVRAIGA